MKYLAFAMKLFIMATGLYMMWAFPDTSNPPFMSGLAFFVIGAYLGIQGVYGSKFSGCIFVSKEGKCCHHEHKKK